MASSDAKPFPVKNQAYRVTFPILDADGDLVSGAAGLDSEISKDGAAFTDCTNEATEIATSSGMYYLDLTATEMNADTVAIIVKTSTSGAKTTPIVLYPVENTDIPVNVKALSDDVTAADNLELDYDGTGYAKANSTIGTCTANSDMRGTDNAALAATALSTAVWTNARAGYLDNINGHTAQTGDSFARLGAPAGASVSADIAAVKTDTAAILVDTGTTLDNHLIDIKGAGFIKDTHSLPQCLTASGFAVAGDAMALTTGERNSVADAILGRSVANTESTAAEWSLTTIVLAALESSISGTTWTIKRTDGSTTHATKTVAKDASAEPITGVS